MGILNEHITPTGYRLGGTPVNENPFWGDGGGNTKTITATASVDNTTGTPSVEVTKTETTEAVNFDFAFSHLKGEQGEQGEQGDPGTTPEVSATANITDTGSTPSVTVTKTGTTAAPVFNFTFDHIGGGGGNDKATWIPLSYSGNAIALRYIFLNTIRRVFDSLKSGTQDYIDYWAAHDYIVFTANVKGHTGGGARFNASPIGATQSTVDSSVMYNVSGTYTSDPVSLQEAIRDGSIGVVNIAYEAPTMIDGYINFEKVGPNATINFVITLIMGSSTISFSGQNIDVYCDGTTFSFQDLINIQGMDGTAYFYVNDTSHSFSTAYLTSAEPTAHTFSGADVFRLAYASADGEVTFLEQLNAFSRMGNACIPYIQIRDVLTDA